MPGPGGPRIHSPPPRTQGVGTDKTAGQKSMTSSSSATTFIRLPISAAPKNFRQPLRKRLNPPKTAQTSLNAASAKGQKVSHVSEPDQRSLGAARSRAIASSKLDFPDPLGPMSTFRGAMGRSTPLGPNDSRPDTFSLRSSMRAPPLGVGGRRLRRAVGAAQQVRDLPGQVGEVAVVTHRSSSWVWLARQKQGEYPLGGALEQTAG